MPTLLRYKDYDFQINPSKFQLRRGRILKVFQPPVQTSSVIPKTQIQDLGLEPMRVTGEGVLFGDNLMGRYTALYDLFLQQGSGLLHLPGLTPFHCYFEQLSVVGQAGHNLLHYAFSFLEDCQQNASSPKMVRDFYITRIGDTLATLATRFETTVALLLAHNPHVNAKTTLEEGTLLWL